ncbi:MAG: ABC-F family ATP-binding cassette domain-containing protein [Saprospiraceae bacterium]
MIRGSNIYIQYGDRILLNNVNLVIGERDKLGLVGRNGAGKSTILKLIAGVKKGDSGQIDRPKGSSLGFLHQEMNLPKGKTVLDETLTAFEEVKAIEERIEVINEALGTRTDYESDAYTQLIEDLSEANEQFLVMGGNSMDADAEKILKGLGFKDSDFHRLTDEFSGGWQMRIELAKMLLSKPDYLLLDEPTNHLDIESIIWLESFLKDYPGAVVLISHDKQFLDKVTKRTIEVELGKLFDYKASYSNFVTMRKERREMQASAFKNQQNQIAHKEKIINKFMAKATKTKMAQSMKKQLDKVERIEIDSEDVASMNIKFPPAPRSGEVVLDTKNLVKQYGDLMVLENIELKLDRGDRVAFVGQNGQGKTTLAKIIVNELSATRGDLNLGHNVQIGYYAQNQSDALFPNMTLLETMEAASPPEMRTKLRSILGAFMFSGEDVEKKVSVLSGGERARLALACLLLKPFNLLVLDEPTNHLDIISKDVLKRALIEYDGTLIVVSHDREFLVGLTNRTVEFRDRQLYNHIGDVKNFLEKRAIESMRLLAMNKSKAKKEKAAEKKEMTEAERKEKKKLERAVQNAERKIEDIEAKIAKIEIEMGVEGFYENPDHTKVIEKYQKLKSDLDTAMEAWEDAQEALES